MPENDPLFDRLLAKYFLRNISVEDKETLFSRIMQSPADKDRYEKAAKLNALLHLSVFESHKQDDYRLLKEKIANPPDKQSGRNKTRRIPLFRRIATAVILVVLSSAGSVYLHDKYTHQEEQLRWIETSTPLGGQTRLLLPDGSVAWVNAKSELKYSSRFGTANRNLYLDGGAYFEVNKHKELPFSVRTGDMEVIATGTTFNICSYSEDNKSEVVLLEGGVDIIISDKRYSLVPDEKMIYDKTSASATIEQTDTQMVARWIKGKLSFYQASIPEIYRMLERHFNVRIQIDDDELKNEYFLGSINLGMNLSEILRCLDVDKKYKIEVRNDVIVIKRK
ncbi:MAG: FecR family protein [Tannerellaceae bacterium]|jgi:ferric-dicitrate binding protein FerR (iron transport regulator)|nr:FecR family protein [Tannerellaceae bacterium]